MATSRRCSSSRPGRPISLWPRTRVRSPTGSAPKIATMARPEFTVTSVPAPGRMHVDWEERVDFRRLHTYRLGRAQQAIVNAGLGAVLVFDMNNIRYLTSTTIGEWARDKVARFALLTRGGDPILWDFGSAAKAHRLHAPWLKPENSRSGMTGLRGSVAPDVGLSDDVARTVKEMMREQGVAVEPLGVDIAEMPMVFALQNCGIKVVDGQQAMLDARQIKSLDEITLLSMSAALVDGVYQTIYEALKPGIRENEIVAIANKRLYDMGSDDVEAINAVSGERCSPHPHVFSDRLMISRFNSLEPRFGRKEGMVFALETYCPADDGHSAARIEEEVVVTATGHEVITLFPAEELVIANAY